MRYIHLWLENLELILFYAFIFFLPFNIKKYLGELAPNNFNFESAFLYLSDILIIVMFLIILLKYKEVLKKLFLKKESLFFISFILSGFLVFIKETEINVGLFLYYFAHFVIIYLVFLIVQVFLLMNIVNLNKIAGIFILSMFLQALLIIGQFSMQKNITVKAIGESIISPLINNVAKIEINPIKYIRGYGTFPHPNMAAVYFLTAIIWLLSLKQNFLGYRRYFYYLNLGILFIGLFFTFSRLTIILTIIASTIYLIFLKKTETLLFLLIIFSIISYFLLPFFLARISYERQNNFDLRQFLNKTALTIIKNNFSTGIGLGQFIENIKKYGLSSEIKPFMLEPVHNIYLLIFAETGLTGLTLFLLFIYMMLKKCKTLLKKAPIFNLPLIFLSFLTIGLFDHHFVTLPQGQLIFILISGIISSRN